MVLGAGGSGVSVLAAAGSMEAARSRRGARPAGPLALTPGGGTLLVTVDPRSSLPDRLGVFRVPGEPVSVTADLDLLHLDPLEVSEAAWREFAAALAAIGSGRRLPVVGTLAGLDAGELTSLPGVQEFLLLRRIRDAATSGKWQRVVVDLSGPTDPFEMLRAPTALAAMIERLWPRHGRLAEATEKAYLAQLAGAVEGIDRDCRDLSDLFGDPDSVAVHLAVDGGDRGLRIAPEHLAIADLMGLPLRSVLVNAGPGGLPTAEVAARIRSTLGAECSAVGIVEIAAAADPLERVARIRRLGVSLPAPDGNPHGSADARLDHLSGEGVGAEYRLSWTQGLPDPDRLALGRSADDLLVTVSGFRHPVRLPPVLRRCLVSGADWDGRRLNVTFRPDPAVWPKRAGGN
ncbi:MAG: ArsA-related P-loop ATPase [Gordonia sp. (in: high G+C Gram-positive bacteria)]|uniref:ArsA-related P-loop ATPase n=1 Tax=Gordonia sp. (in: high G+C Gram-positive bacteria) TaxID=84139 RepID=UPI0039E2AC11